MPPEFEKREVLVAALQAAAQAIRETKELRVREKLSAGDLLTEADLRAERAAKETIGGDVFISEEREGALEARDPNFTGWVLDPLDGTNNFVRGIPFYSVSLGYIEAGEPSCGGVLDVVHKDLFVAARNQGAWLGDTRLSVSDAQEFGPGVRVCSSTSYEPLKTQENLRRYKNLGDVWVDFLSSAALDFCYLAAGRIDLFHHNGLLPWDSAAGFLIAKESGAQIVRLQGEQALWHDSEIIAGNSALVDRFLEISL